MGLSSFLVFLTGLSSCSGSSYCSIWSISSSSTGSRSTPPSILATFSAVMSSSLFSSASAGAGSSSLRVSLCFLADETSPLVKFVRSPIRLSTSSSCLSSGSSTGSFEADTFSAAVSSASSAGALFVSASKSSLTALRFFSLADFIFMLCVSSSLTSFFISG